MADRQFMPKSGIMMPYVVLNRHAGITGVTDVDGDTGSIILKNKYLTINDAATTYAIKDSSYSKADSDSKYLLIANPLVSNNVSYKSKSSTNTDIDLIKVTPTNSIEIGDIGAGVSGVVINSEGRVVVGYTGSDGKPTTAQLYSKRYRPLPADLPFAVIGDYVYENNDPSGRVIGVNKASGINSDIKQMTGLTSPLPVPAPTQTGHAVNLQYLSDNYAYDSVGSGLLAKSDIVINITKHLRAKESATSYPNLIGLEGAGVVVGDVGKTLLLTAPSNPKISVGGGASQEIYHEGNKPSLSVLPVGDAGTVRGALGLNTNNDVRFNRVDAPAIVAGAAGLVSVGNQFAITAGPNLGDTARNSVNIISASSNPSSGQFVCQTQYNWFSDAFTTGARRGAAQNISNYSIEYNGGFAGQPARTWTFSAIDGSFSCPAAISANGQITGGYIQSVGNMRATGDISTGGKFTNGSGATVVDREINTRGDSGSGTQGILNFCTTSGQVFSRVYGENSGRVVVATNSANNHSDSPNEKYFTFEYNGDLSVPGFMRSNGAVVAGSSTHQTDGNLTGSVFGASGYLTAYLSNNYQPIASSDERLKTDITDYDGLESLSNIDKMELKTFVFKSDEQKRVRRGVIAQQIEKIDPEYTRMILEGTDEEKLTLDSNVLLLDAIAAIQALSKKVSDLEAQLKDK